MNYRADMMFRAMVPLLAIGGLACQEYSIDGWQRATSVPNPPSLATPTKTDVILQTTPGKVDVLFVLDDSSSMREEQEKLARNLPVFLDYFLESGLSWHIGVVTTDVDGDNPGELKQAAGYSLITRSTPEPIALFENLVRVGTGGSGDEKGLFATFLALAQPSARLASTNRGMNRDGASLHIIVVSDEEDSSGTDMTPGELSDYLLSSKAALGYPVTFNSIVGPGPRGCNNNETGAVHGARYEEVTQTVGGSLWSICQADWAPILDELGVTLTSIRKEFFLSDVPVPGTLEAWVDDRGRRWRGYPVDGPPPEADACGDDAVFGCFAYRYNDRRNSITFMDYVPTPQAEIRLSYALLDAYQGTLGDTAEP